jgi:glycine oxidase
VQLPISLKAQPTIAIAGAGLVGSLLAWRLLRQGATVTVYERNTLLKPRAAAYTAAAMISPLSEVVVSERAIYDMGLDSLRLWPQWLSELAQITPAVHYNNQGSLVVAHPNDAAELEQFASDLRFHLGADNTARWLSPEELKSLEPDLNPQLNPALLLPNEAHLDNRQLLNNLHAAIQRLGGKIIENADITFQPEATLQGKALAADWVIDARGTGAKQSQAVRGVRGEVLWVHTQEVHFTHAIRLMHPRYKLYIVPKPNHHFIVGATEIESQDDSPVSVQSMMELCSALYTLNPAFAEARITELDANLRPSYLDNLPKIIWDADTQSASINGLYRHGYLLAPHLINQFMAQFNQRFN